MQMKDLLNRTRPLVDITELWIAFLVGGTSLTPVMGWIWCLEWLLRIVCHEIG